MGEDRLATLTESVPAVDQPVASRLPVFRDYFDMPSPPYPGDGERIAVGGGRVFVTRHTHLANMEEPAVQMRDAVTLALVGSFGGTPANGDCARPGRICEPTGIAYYRGKVYISDSPWDAPNRVSVWNANGTFDREVPLTWMDANGVVGISEIRGIDVAWGEIWLTSGDHNGAGGSMLATESRKLEEVAILDYQTGAPKALLPHPVAAPYLSSACYSDLTGSDTTAWECRANGDGVWNDLSIVPERGSVYAGYRAIQRGVLPASLAYSEPEGRCDGCTPTLGRQEGTDAPWGMRWLLTANSYCNGCDYDKNPELRINEFSVESTLDGRPYLAKRRSWHPQQSNCECRQDVAYFNRELRIDWSGALTKPDWINGTQSVNYIVSDADIFVTGRVGERWYELARNFSRVELAIDGVVRASSTSPNSTLSYDTSALTTGLHTLTLTAYLNDGAKVVSTNSQLRIDRDGPTGTVADPGRYVSSTVTVEGTVVDAHSGPRDWQLETLAPGAGSWRAACSDATPDPATQRYGCDWSTTNGTWPDGPYRLRARARDTVDSQVTNVRYSAEVTTLVDNTPPSMQLSGDGWDRRDLAPMYDDERPAVVVDAADAGSGVTRIDLFVDGVQAGFMTADCASGGCNRHHVFTLQPQNMADGKHEIRVVAQDGAGRTTQTQWTVDVELLFAGPENNGPAARTAALAGPGDDPALPDAPSLPLYPVLPLDIFDPNSPKFDASRFLDCTGKDQAPNFDTFSLGESFEGLPLTARMRVCEQPKPPVPYRANYVSYVYGTCDLYAELGQDFQTDQAPSELRCAEPLEVQSWPICERNKARYLEGQAADTIAAARPDQELTIRGVPAAIYDDGQVIELYTGTATVAIFGDDIALMQRAANAIVQVQLPPTSALSGALKAGQRPRTSDPTDSLPGPLPGGIDNEAPCMNAVAYQGG